MDKKCLLLVSKKLDLRKNSKYYTQCLFTQVARLQHKTRVHCNQGEKGKETHISSMSIICWFYLIVLVCSGCSYKNNINWVAYKWQTFISHHSEGWELQDHATSRFSVWWDPSFWFTDFIVFVLCPRMAEGARDLSEAFFIWAQIPSRQDPKATPFWELGFQHKFWGGQKHLDYSTHKILMPQMDGQVDGARCRP